jgi:actin-related protein 4
MHEFKETACEVLAPTWDDACVSLSPLSYFVLTDEYRYAASKPTRPFEFPDGYNSYFGTVRMSAPEIIFNPGRFLPADVSLSSAPLSCD